MIENNHQFADRIRPERHRIQALSNYSLLNTEAEPEFDQITRFCAHLFAVPMCVISIVGQQRQWFKSRYGIDIAGTAREISFCHHTLASEQPFVVPDATADLRFRDNPLVTGAPSIRFYAGAPLIDSAGVYLGALCVLDTERHEDFGETKRLFLVEMAAMVVSRIEQRRGAALERAVTGFADATSLALMTANDGGRITFWNRAAEDMFGYSSAEAIGMPVEQLIPARFRQEHRNGLARLQENWPHVASGKTMEVIACRRDGGEFPIELSLTIWQGPRGFAFGTQIQEISERRRREQRLRHLAEHDSLTGLANRNTFHAHLGEVLERAGPAALLALDLNGFKLINDSFGHAMGDALLQAISLRLINVFPSSAALARLGGDEFAVLLGEGDPDIACDMAEQMLHAFREPFHISGHLLQIGLCAGIAMRSDEVRDADEFLMRADLALLAAKAERVSKVRLFDNAMESALAARRAFRDEVRTATEKGQWELVYQPQRRLVDGKLCGVEALLRWRHPTRGLLGPAAFLQVLETHAAAFEVGSWVIEEACRQLASWRDAGVEVPRIGVNAFAAQFTSGLLEQVTASALEQNGLLPSDLEIEITERIALRPDDQILQTLRAMREAGVHIALDDFGTGFASLTTIKALPVTRLKIDKSFIGDICDDRHSAAIVAAIISLAKGLDLEVVAEGIETRMQADVLRALGCDTGQGYLLGRPVSGEAIGTVRPDAPLAF